ncbi:MAG: hypothetical protein MHMPM18_003242 [Marteilia pararefringens]
MYEASRKIIDDSISEVGAKIDEKLRETDARNGIIVTLRTSMQLWIDFCNASSEFGKVTLRMLQEDSHQ